jgi:pimeloyl-ACP methyl ester carboxylesterase
MKKYLNLLIGLLMVVVVTSCSKTENTTPAVENQYLVSSTLLSDLTRPQLQARLLGAFPGDQQTSTFLAAFVNMPVRIYRLTYKTKNFDNSEVVASGALVVPVADNASMSFPLISQQHGTIRDDASAPSNNAVASETSLGALMASTGYIIALPDYIGYGASRNVAHPYEHRETLAQACLDMIRASKEFIAQEKVNWNQKVMLAGYSQGGFATMSLLKKIEEQFPTEFTIAAASCGAGAYDKVRFMQDLVNTRTHGIADYNGLYTWVLSTYNRVYGLNRPMSFYLKAPYAAAVEQNLNGPNIPISFNEAVTDGFRMGINSITDTQFLTAVRDNNVFDWRPRTPLQLYHGDADQQVFIINSENAFNAMRARGATNVEFIRVAGGTHGSVIQNFLLGSLQFFNGKK